MSRTSLAIAGAALIAAGLGAAAYAQQPTQPPFATTRVEGTDNVYIFRAGNHQSMFVVTSAGVIATDPIGYGRPEMVTTYVDEIRKVTNKPIKYLIYSHHHFDHIAGGKPFKDAGATIIAHKRAKERLVALKDPHTVLPDETMDKSRTIRLGTTTLELTYVGLNHSDSSIVMRLPKDKILFAVDFIPVGTMPGRAMIDSYPIEWEDSLKKVLAMDWDTLIPGHPGAPGGRLAYLAALTKRIRLGTGIMQLAARPPASAAMAAGTVDALAGGGRVIAGLGVSGPQIVEGWYGQPWGRPYWRIRDYVAIMRKVFERKEPVAHAGREISLPYTGPGALGVGKPLMPILHMNPRLPIWPGTGTEANVKPTAEIADGWLPLGFVPRLMPMLRPWLEEGFRRAGGTKGFADFEIQPRAEAAITDDIKAALARQKPRVALYVGGMVHRDKNFHKEMMVRRGFGEAAQRIQELFLARRKDEAEAAVPDEFCDEMALVGSVARIRERYRAWAECGITGLTLVTDQPEAMELMAGLAR